MSRPVPQEISCPKCGEKSTFTSWSSLNVTLNPHEKQKLIDRSLFQFVCGKCRASATVVYSLLYHDMVQKLMIWLLPEGPEGETGQEPPGGAPGPMKKHGYRFRSVATQNDLVEKILIFDAGLDDGPIELLKRPLWNDLPAEAKHDDTRIFFSELSDKTPAQLKFVVLTPKGAAMVAVDREPAYSKMVEMWEELLAAAPLEEDWPRVDVRRLVEMVERQGEKPGKTGDAGAGSSLGEQKRLPAPKRWWKFW